MNHSPQTSDNSGTNLPAHRCLIHETFQRLIEALDQSEVCFVVAGAFATGVHGYRRTTPDVDVILRRVDLQRFKENWLGSGWEDAFEGSNGLRDSSNNVRVLIHVTGNYPGDGRPKPIVVPDPESVAVVIQNGVPYINLTELIEQKLASGMTGIHRLRDLDDVNQLIRVNELKQEFADSLDLHVRPIFDRIWQAENNGVSH